MNLRKALVVANAEFGMLVRTKAFIITLILLPVMVVGSAVVQRMLGKQIDPTPRKLAVIDRSGAMYDDLARVTAARNAIITDETGARYDLERVEPTGKREELLLALSERVRKKEIFAFVDIPADVLDPKTEAKISYYSDNPTYTELPKWVDNALNEQIRGRRLRDAKLDPKLIESLVAELNTEQLGLFARDEAGNIAPAKKVDGVRTYIIPFALMYLLFLVIFTTAPQAMTLVVEEKMNRISEVLLGSVAPFELMLGKLLGSTGATLVLATIYVGGGLFAAQRFGMASAITPGLLLLFLLFLLLAVLLFGSIMIAIGSACTGLKDAQSLMTPVMLICVMPLLTVQGVLQSPNGPFAVGISLVPLATPFIMLLRVAMHPGPPVWQVILSIVGCAAFTLLVVAAAGRIFRVGLLVQGKSATFGQMLRWAVQRG